MKCLRFGIMKFKIECCCSLITAERFRCRPRVRPNFGMFTPGLNGKVLISRLTEWPKHSSPWTIVLASRRPVNVLSPEVPTSFTAPNCAPLFGVLGWNSGAENVRTRGTCVLNRPHKHQSPNHVRTCLGKNSAAWVWAYVRSVVQTPSGLHRTRLGLYSKSCMKGSYNQS